ncbi:MAG TPA: helix-turn-helix domain-containing protein [Novosphingobium sp.]
MSVSDFGSVKQVRALERGLDVLLAVRSGRGVTLNALHLQLGLSKATLLRLLKTLRSRGLVWRRLADGVWLPSQREGVAFQSDAARLLAEVAAPLLVELSERAVWPSVLAIPRYDHMEIVETNSPVSRFDFAALGPIGAKLSYLHPATGRAYLSACGAEARAALIARLGPREGRDDNGAGAALLESIITETRRRGYSTREPHHPWADRDRSTVLRDNKTSIAIAVMTPRGPIASLNITWPTGRVTLEAAVAKHLTTMRSIASRIASEAMAAGFTQ